MYFILIILILFTILWFRKNDRLISIDKYKDGVLLNKSVRCRYNKKKDQYIPLLSFFGKKQILKDKIKDVENNFITIESMPIIGVTKQLNLIKRRDEYISWKPPTEITNKGFVSNTKIVRMNNLMLNLYENTENSNKNEVIQKYIVPIALIILAMVCIIFFPKIYDKIMEFRHIAYDQALSQWQDAITKIKPVG